ncbi:carbonic anhydrase [Pluteus cervinus]|uniref:Carbonic anhydrase n=1 Tax=Pluteus cervinus TaxID=181527 RepID=A0ACD3BFX3_9AGAR|nr:carbonic anhydrase [Pluteus cervinus]
MSGIDFVEQNKSYAATFDQGHLEIPPTKNLIILTCIDARIDPASQLGLKLGEAHVIRNAGGVAKDAIRSIVISQRLLGTKEIAVFHHVGCGMLLFETPKLRDIVKGAAPGDAAVASAVDAIDFLEFSNVEEGVRADVEYLKNHPLVLKGSIITGWVYDVTTGKVHKVV